METLNKLSPKIKKEIIALIDQRIEDKFSNNLPIYNRKIFYGETILYKIAS